MEISDPEQSQIPRYPQEITLEKVRKQGINPLLMTVPCKYLFPIQTPNEYSASKHKSIAIELNSDPLSYLEQHPIAVVFLPGEKTSQLAITDGHHRVKEAKKKGITKIPSMILTPEQLTLVWNHFEKNNLTTEQRLQRWSSSIAESIDALSDANPLYKAPLLLPGIQSFEMLIANPPKGFLSFETATS